MTELEMTKLTALAMWGGHGKLAGKVVAYEVNDCAVIAPNAQGGESVWDPLHDDTQAMALVRRFEPAVYRFCGKWCAELNGRHHDSFGLNRAIVECVATMQRDCAQLKSNEANK